MLNFTKPTRLLLYLLILSLAGLCFEFIFSKDDIENLGINKTIGWAFDFCAFMSLSVLLTILLSFAGYGILALFRVRIDRIISIIHFIIVLGQVIGFVLNLPVAGCDLVLLLSLLSVVMLVANSIYAIIKKQN